jgi:hypothetical protein
VLARYLLLGLVTITLASCSTARSAGPAYKSAAIGQKLPWFTLVYAEKSSVPAGELSVLHQRGSSAAISQAHLADAPKEVTDLLVKVNGYAHERLKSASGSDKHVFDLRFIQGQNGVPQVLQTYPDLANIDGAVLLIEPVRGDYYCEKMMLAPDWCRPRLLVKASLFQKSQLLWSFDVRVQRDSLLIPLSSETIDTMWGTIDGELRKSGILTD